MERPERVAWHVARARERAGLSVRAAAAAAGMSVDALEAVEAGWRQVEEHEIERLARSYGVTPDVLVPPRTPVVVDPDSGTLGIGDRVAPLGEQGDDALSAYLTMLYEARGVSRGQRVPLRDEDLDVLAGLVGDDADEVEARLIELMDCSPEEARSLRALLFRRRVVAAAAGVVLGLGIAPGIAWQSRSPSSVGVAAGGDHAMGVVHQEPDGDEAPDAVLGGPVAVPIAFSSSPAAPGAPTSVGSALSDAPIDDVTQPAHATDPGPGDIDIGTALVIVRPPGHDGGAGPGEGTDDGSPDVGGPQEAPPDDVVDDVDDDTDRNDAPGGLGAGTDDTDTDDTDTDDTDTDDTDTDDTDTDTDDTDTDDTDTDTGDTETDTDDDGGNNGQGVGVGETPPGHQDDGDTGDNDTDDDGNNGQGGGVGGTPPGHQDDPGDSGDADDTDDTGDAGDADDADDLGGSDDGNDAGQGNGAGSTPGGQDDEVDDQSGEGTDGDGDGKTKGNKGKGIGVGETPPGHEDNPSANAGGNTS